MYIRIQNQSIRYRISRDEAAMLLNGQRLEDKLNLSSLLALTYSIDNTSSQSSFNFIDDSKELHLKINIDVLKAELEDRPSKQGIMLASKNSSTTPDVYLEIDLKKNSKKLINY
ncbi:DUF7009 family protein [Aliikangiella sp. IMCC44359]|uniref:DUF7009 family protein n=1 Tax=Aliikangiella sp. IMCC44359 TaxID=3459125 RepID=UPI00403AEDC4